EPAHAVRQPRRPEPRLHQRKAPVEPAEDLPLTDAAISQKHLTVPTRPAAVHRRDAADDLPAGVAGIDEKERGPVLDGDGRIGDGSDDGEGGSGGAADEPLVAVNDPLVALLLGASAEHGRIGAGAGCRLGHGEAGAALAAREWLEILRSLLWRGRPEQQVH